SGELIGVWSGRGDVNQFVHVVDGDVVGIRFGWETDGWSSINLWVTGCRITGGLIIEGHQITHAGVPVGGLHFDDVHAGRRICHRDRCTGNQPDEQPDQPYVGAASLPVAVCPPAGRFRCHHAVTCRTVFALSR